MFVGAAGRHLSASCPGALGWWQSRGRGGLGIWYLLMVRLATGAFAVAFYISVGWLWGLDSALFVLMPCLLSVFGLARRNSWDLAFVVVRWSVAPALRFVLPVSLLFVRSALGLLVLLAVAVALSVGRRCGCSPGVCRTWSSSWCVRLLVRSPLPPTSSTPPPPPPSIPVGGGTWRIVSVYQFLGGTRFLWGGFLCRC